MFYLSSVGLGLPKENNNEKLTGHHQYTLQRRD